MCSENWIGGILKRIPTVAWILLLGCVLRTAAVTVRFENLQIDRDNYLLLAENLLAGNGYCSMPGQPTAYRPPLYPLLVAVCLKVGGFAAIGVVQVLLGAATVWLTWLMANRCRLSRRTCLLAGLFVAVDPLLIEYTTQAMTETLSTFLVTLLVLTTLQSGREIPKAVLIGFVFGMAALCRPSIWAFGGLAAACWLIRNVRGGLARSHSTPRADLSFVPVSCACLAAVAITVSPWVIRNARQFGRPILMTTHGGYTLLLANNETFFDEVVASESAKTWRADSLTDWQIEQDRRLASLGIAKTDEVSRDAALSRLAKDWIINNPLKFIRCGVLRLQRFWACRPSESAGVPSWLIQIIGAYYLGVMTMAAIGLVQWRNRWLDCWTVPTIVLSLTLVHSVYWSNARMRAALVPVISLATAAAVQRSGINGGATLQR
jgi:hypothetical protein